MAKDAKKAVATGLDEALKDLGTKKTVTAETPATGEKKPRKKHGAPVLSFGKWKKLLKEQKKEKSERSWSKYCEYYKATVNEWVDNTLTKNPPKQAGRKMSEEKLNERMTKLNEKLVELQELKKLLGKA